MMNLTTRRYILTLSFCLLFFHTFANISSKKQEVLNSTIELIQKEVFKDSTQNYLNQIERLKKGNDKSDIIPTAEFALKIGAELSQKHQFALAINYLTETIHQLQNFFPETEEGKITLVNLIDELGSIYHTAGLANQSMDTYFKALVIAERYQLDSQSAILYNNVASIYMELNQYQQADSLYRKAIAINEAKKDTEKLFINYNNIAVIYARQLQYDKALEYAFLALHLLKEKTDDNIIYLMKRNIGSIYLKKKELSLAKEQITDVIAFQEAQKQEINLITSYGIMAEIESLMKHNESANTYIDKAISLATKYNESSTKSELLKKKAFLLRQGGQYEKAVQLLANVIQIRDSLHIQEGQSRVQSISNLIKEEEQQHQMQLTLQQRRNKEKLLLIIYLVILILATILIIVGSIYWIGKWKKKSFLSMKKIILNKQDYLKQQNKQIDSLIQQIQEANQTTDISERKRTVLSLQAMRNQEYIEKLQADLNHLLNEFSPKEQSMKNSVRKILIQANQYENNSNWKEFEDSFQNIHSSFFDNLKKAHPDLSVKENRLCALIIIGLNTKEIAEITYKEVRSVESARNRLRKKLGIEATDDLQEYLTQFKAGVFREKKTALKISDDSLE